MRQHGQGDGIVSSQAAGILGAVIVHDNDLVTCSVEFLQGCEGSADSPSRVVDRHYDREVHRYCGTLAEGGRFELLHASTPDREKVYGSTDS